MDQPEDGGVVLRLHVLFATAAEAQAAGSEATILEAVARGLNRVGLSARVALLDDGDDADGAPSGRLVLRHQALLPAAERLRRGLPVGTELEASAPPYDAVLGRGEVVWEADAAAGHGVSVPVRDGATVIGALTVWGMTITELDVPAVALLGRHAGGALARLRYGERALEQARLDGARLVARTAAHELNNALSPVVGFAQLLALSPTVAREPQLAAYARAIGDGADQASEKLWRLQRIDRLVETESVLGPHRPVLDLERSAPEP